MINILVIEDSEADFRLTQRHLKRAGIDADCTRVDTREAIIQALQNNCWSLVLLDYNIPEVAFKDALKLIQQLQPDLPTILVSGSFEEESGLELLKRGVWDFIPKENLARLPSVIERSMQNSANQKLLRLKEEQLRQNEARFKTYVESAPISIWVLDQNLRFIDSNPAGFALVKHTEKTLFELALPDVIRSQEQGLLRADLKKLKELGRTISEYTLCCSDGEERMVQIHAIQYEPEKLLAYCQDITELRQAEHQLRIAALAFESNDSIVIIDAQRKIKRINQAFSHTTGYSAEEAVGEDYFSIISKRESDCNTDEIWKMIEENGSWQGERWSQRKNGQRFLEWLSITSFRDSDNQLINYVAISRDITERRESEEKIARMALYDSLTNLPNRRLLQDRLKTAIQTAERFEQYGALMFIDLDHFKVINDTLGHDYGDKLLIEVAVRLQGCVRKSDTLARLGGDEFIILLENLSHISDLAILQARSIAKIILYELSKTFTINSRPVNITPSIGVALFNGRNATGYELLKWADLAMYQAKSSGRNTVRFFDPVMQAKIEERALLEAELHRAIKAQEFCLYFQKKVDRENNCTGFEALIRWQHPEKGILPPKHFIAFAEESGMIEAIGGQVLRAACRQMRCWSKCTLTREISVAVNVSAKQFKNPYFAEEIEQLLTNSIYPPFSLTIELTESLLAENIEDIALKMRRLKQCGVQFALDDFGTGYSSLSYLKHFPFDFVKIDRSFVCDMLENTSQAGLVRAIIAMAHSLGLKVIAEGVETPAQWQFLREEGCDEAQGYLFGEPRPPLEIQFN